MPALNFTSFSGAVPRCKSFEVSEYQGMLYIIPEDMKSARRYDPFPDYSALLLDVVRVGAVVASCDALFEYTLKHEILPIEETEFWRCGDFFASHPKEGAEIVSALLDFAGKYGLPAWDVRHIVSADYPARYDPRLMRFRRKQDVGDDVSYMVGFELMRRGCQSKGSLPVCTFALIMLDLYLKFIEGTGEAQFPISSADWMLHYRHEKTPELTAQVYDLLSCINLSYALLVSGEGRAIRQCKNCQSFFIAEDLRAEYCSPRCRGAYNSKMTRKRVKERQIRGEQ